MEMIELLRARRSARSFKDEPVPGEMIDLLKEALVRAPTSRDNRPWEFVFVDDRNLLAQLSSAKPHGASFLRDAPLGVVILADETKSDVWVEDCAIAAITLQYQCESLGLGSCWVQIRMREFAAGISSEKRVKELLHAPDHLRVACIVAIGFRKRKARETSFDSLPHDRFHTNGF